MESRGGVSFPRNKCFFWRCEGRVLHWQMLPGVLFSAISNGKIFFSLFIYNDELEFKQMRAMYLKIKQPYFRGRNFFIYVEDNSHIEIPSM